MTIETRPAEVVSVPKVKTTADVLRHAAWIIEEYGWTGVAGPIDEHGRHCAWGAITAAIHGPARDGVLPQFQTDDAIPALRALVRVIHGGIGGAFAGGAVANWNDTPGRTAAEVTAALRAAADASERAS